MEVAVLHTHFLQPINVMEMEVDYMIGYSVIERQILPKVKAVRSASKISPNYSSATFATLYSVLLYPRETLLHSNLMMVSTPFLNPCHGKPVS